ncbi:MAG TPA: hypothetical protein VG367_17220 [Mucilaginibacter sp.]|jgi:hypothetical protein|nr:hypothetical protein [Mucilaginibacter sp.]
MEVHHHPQLHHDKKPWKEYLLEGLMIFLAVFMGFIAESLRERIADKNREREYMVSMVEDLRSDTTALSAFIIREKVRIAMADSLIDLLYSANVKQEGNDLYFFARNMSLIDQVIFNDRTRQQLKSSGNMRLVNNVKVSNAIMAYDQALRETEFQMGQVEILRQSYREVATKVFNMKIFNDMLRDGKIARLNTNPQLFSTDAAAVNTCVGAIQYVKNAALTQSREAVELLKNADELIKLIKQGYNLKEE